MIRIIKISIAFFLLLLFGAPSCVNEEEHQRRAEAKLMREIEQIYTDMASIDLSDSVLLIYQHNAQNQLMDMADYFHILSDTTLDITMREKAGELILQNFVSEEVIIRLPLLNHKGMALGLFIDLVLNDERPETSSHFDSITIEQGLQKWEDHSYKGIMNFQQILQDSSAENSSRPLSIDFYLMQEEKIFGSDTLKIWEIHFGDIH